MAEKQLKEHGNNLIKMLEDVFKQAPSLPENAREVLVKIAPWLALIFGILGLLAGLAAIGISPVAMFGGVRSSTTLLISGVVTLISSGLMLMAYPQLVKRTYRGWELLFWSEIVNVVAVLLAFSLGSILSLLIGLYLLFQIKGHYK